MKLKHQRTNHIFENIKVADSFFDRLIGLMFKEKMEGFEGLLIKKCNSIHTFFMRYNLDIVFLNHEYEVVKVIENIRPWRMTLMYFRATQTLELNGGTLKGLLTKGDKLEVLCTN
jgi:uncharacterized membrane protein (UPF0127 family)